MYRAVGTRIRQHPRLVDTALATPLLVISTAAAASVPDDPVWWIALLVAGGQCAPVLIRRERPMTAFVITAGAAFAQWLLTMGLLPANLVLFAALYNVASRCRWQHTAFAAAVVELGAVLVYARWFVPAGDWLRLPVELIPVTILIGSMWIWGTSVRTRRAYLVSLRERAVQAERERDNQAHIAAATERARIAREMHDIVSHSLSVITVQADGAAYAMTTNPNQARQAVDTIAATGRYAQTEMRRMLGILRSDEPDPQHAPQPGLDQLDQLVEKARHAGLPVEFTVDGTPRTLPTGVELAAYRVVQEALTNTLKHAGPGVSAVHLRLHFSENTLQIHMCDDGRGAAAPRGGPHHATTQHQGHGLIGMYERVTAYGGSLHTGSRAGGGFEVAASLRLQPEDG